MPSNKRSEATTLGKWIANAQKAFSIFRNEQSSSLYAIANFVLNRSTTWVISHPEHLLNKKEIAKLDACIIEVINGKPLPYIIEKQYFYGREFYVNPDVLIPRPETELLVENVIHTASRFHKTLRIADIGTGSGCIAISLAKALPNSTVIATDISFPALEVAKKNLNRYLLNDRVRLIQANLLHGIRQKFNILCANLPYVPVKTLLNLEVIKFEPRIALDGGQNGLQLIKQFLAGAQTNLFPNGMIFLEIEYSQETLIQRFCKRLFPYSSCTIIKDLAKKPRLAVIRFYMP
ncbi:MAG: peptide chain release factor N(5)-glutamine methyltransferase [Anaerolineaceae bacterium]|nr:peptide chain release factor N(5)-glutamine methyltransferase [Anaerolineaceae bacterium]